MMVLVYSLPCAHLQADAIRAAKAGKNANETEIKTQLKASRLVFLFCKGLMPAQDAAVCPTVLLSTLSHRT